MPRTSPAASSANSARPVVIVASLSPMVILLSVIGNPFLAMTSMVKADELGGISSTGVPTSLLLPPQAVIKTIINAKKHLETKENFLVTS